MSGGQHTGGFCLWTNHLSAFLDFLIRISVTSTPVLKRETGGLVMVYGIVSHFATVLLLLTFLVFCCPFPVTWPDPSVFHRSFPVTKSGKK